MMYNYLYFHFIYFFFSVIFSLAVLFVYRGINKKISTSSKSGDKKTAEVSGKDDDNFKRGIN